MVKSAQYRAAQESIEKGFPVLFAGFEGAECVPRPHRNLMGGEPSIYETAIRSVSELAKYMAPDFSGPLIRVRDLVGGIPSLESKPHAESDWQSQPVVQRHQMTPPTPAREEGVTHRAIKPSAAELVAHVRSAHVALRAACVSKKELGARREKLLAKRDEFDSLEDRYSTARERRKGRQVQDLKHGTTSDFSECDAEIADLREQIDLKRDDAEAASVAITDLQRSLENAEERRIACEQRVSNAVARWARYEQADAITALKNEMEKLGGRIANLAALDSLMEAGGLGHLTQADRYLRELSNPFVGPFALEGRPSWASCHSPSRLPGVAEARERILDRLANADIE